MDAPDRRKVMELLLFLADRPLKTTDLQAVMDQDFPGEEVLKADLAEMGRELDARGSPLQLLEIADGWQLASRPAYSQWVRRLYKHKTTLRLSPSALETLSIVAYKQPITRGEIEEIRGVDVEGVLETLLDRKMVKIIGRKEALGRPLLYGTTLEFMKQFGLKSLDELPRLEELVPPDETNRPLEAPVAVEPLVPEEAVPVAEAPTSPSESAPPA
jgi:segregation and condensation protein B